MRGMRGEFEKSNERNRLRGEWETEWDGKEMGMRVEWNRMRGETEWWWEWQGNETEWDDVFN